MAQGDGWPGRALRRAALLARVEEASNLHDRLARSEEFLIFVPDGNRSRLEVLETRYQAATRDAPVGFTMGCAVSQPGESVADTINWADGKLYARRNRVRAVGR